MLRRLPKSARTSNANELKKLIAESEKDFTKISSDPYIMQDAIEILAKYGNRVLLSDVLRKEGLHRLFASSWSIVAMLTEIYALWIDQEAIISRPDNLLNQSFDKDNWRAAVKPVLAHFLIQYGSVLDYRQTEIGKIDYSERRIKVLAAFDLREYPLISRSEEDTRTSITAHVLLSDGRMRNIFFEGSIADLLDRSR